MAIVMNMSSYEVERVTEIVETYDDEVMYAGWNPQLAVAGVPRAEADRQGAMPSSLAEADVERFLQKMYASQR